MTAEQGQPAIPDEHRSRKFLASDIGRWVLIVRDGEWVHYGKLIAVTDDGDYVCIQGDLGFIVNYQDEWYPAADARLVVRQL